MQIKILYIFILHLLIAFSCAATTWGQAWQTLNGPIESEVTDIVVQNDTVYAAARSGEVLFKRNLDSREWIFVGPTRLSSNKTFTLDEQGNYFAVDHEVVFPTDPAFSIQNFSFSEDYGQSWKIVEDLADMGINEIFVVESGEILFGGNGIYSISEDKHSFNIVDSTFSVNTFYQHHDTLIAGGFNGIGISEDTGNTWENIGPDTLQVHSITSTGDILFVATNNDIILKEYIADDGKLITNLPETTINVLHTADNQVYAGTESGIMLIDIESLTAIPVFPGLTDKNIYSIDSDGDSIYTGTDEGLYKCSPELNSCTLNGIPGGRVHSFTIQGQDTLLTSTSNAIYRYFIDDKKWDTKSVPLHRARNIVPIDDENFHTVNSQFYYRCSFAEVECESFKIDEEHALFDITENTVGQLFIASLRYVYQSNDGGDTWDIIYTHPNNVRQTLKADGDSLLFINGAIKLSLDTHDFEQLPASVYHISSDGTYYGMGESGVEKSNDSGETWSTLLRSSDIIEQDFIRSLEVDEINNKIYAISNTGRVYVSENEGENWGLNTEMHPVTIEHTTLAPDGTLYLGSRSAGVFKNTEGINPLITISNEGEPNTSVPQQFTLSQNYPNPFNPSTTITYSISEPGAVSLTVYNLVGQEVAVLFNGSQNGGVYRVEFDASHLASGLYLYKLETENYSETRKMTLVK